MQLGLKGKLQVKVTVREGGEVINTSAFTYSKLKRGVIHLASVSEARQLAIKEV